MKKRKLPIGVESFTEIRKENYYYADKTGLIKDLINSGSKVTLFTRPRRFGKSLNIDTLKAFFEVDTDATLFHELEISEEKDLCDKYLGKFPVIVISLKDVDGNTYKKALKRMSWTLKKEIRRHQYLIQSKKLSGIDKEDLKILFEKNLSEDVQEKSLYLLSEMLCKHYERKVIILIDEYDVPLDKAYLNGYYSEMLEHTRSMLGKAVKTNDYLQFAVITGCLRIAKESIFTGLNNFKTKTVSDIGFSTYFGFTDAEVRKILKYYDLEEKYSLFKEWYDGYQFGDIGIYCPWDVINQCDIFCTSKDVEMKLHWTNSSSNSIVREIIANATATTRNQIESLISGESIKQAIMSELTYTDLENKDNEIRQTYLWSVLFATGYLTDAGKPVSGYHTLKIPNLEIRKIYEIQILSWFKFTAVNNKTWFLFCDAVENGQEKDVEFLLNTFMTNSISIRDTYSRKDMKENFYHGMLLGLLQANDNWFVKSGQETGTGYADIVVKIEAKSIGCIFEVKYAENGNFRAACKTAMNQIKNKGYASILEQDGMEKIYQYGIAFHKKTCKIVCKQILLFTAD